MPEWQFVMSINFWSQNEEDAQDEAQGFGEAIFKYENVLSVEAPFSPTWIRDDE